MKDSEGIVRISIDEVEPGPYQPRRHFAEKELAELAESIRNNGLIQPILVRPASGRYQLIAGERRWRAAAMVGMKDIPAIVRPMTDEEAAFLAVIENVQREDLHFLEEAEAYQRLIKQFGLTQAELATRLGRSQAGIANRLRLLKLAPEIRVVISREMISERHARALLQLPRGDQQRQVLEKIRARNLTVREAEQLISRMLREAGEAQKRKRVKGVVRDVRIFLNAFRQTAEALLKTGIEAQVEEDEFDDYVEIRVRVPKDGRGIGTRQRKAAPDGENV